MWASMCETAIRPDTRLLVAVDYDDPNVDEYLTLMDERDGRYGMDIDQPLVRVLTADETGDMVKAMNTAVEPFMDRDVIIGMFNDDQRCRTMGWDDMVHRAMYPGPRIVYGNDLFQGEVLATAPFIHVSIVKALGYYCLPVCHHLFVDNAWLDIGRGIGSLEYLPDVVVEHMHPLAGKGEWDEGYERANNDETTDHDRIAYEEWRDKGGLSRDVAQVRLALAR